MEVANADAYMNGYNWDGFIGHNVGLATLDHELNPDTRRLKIYNIEKVTERKNT